MALHKPLVIINGQLQQIPSTGTLDAPQAGGDVLVQTNDEVGAIVIGAPVYNDVADGVKKGQANAAGTSKLLGLVRDTSIAAAATGSIQTNGPLQATTGEWDAVTGGSGGLAVGTKYYLDPATAGKLTATAPTTVGHRVVLVGIAVSTVILNIGIADSILL